MGYRDDREALAARVEQLEGELDEARAEIARLRSGGEKSFERHPLLGGPSRLRFEREIAGALTEDAHEELVSLLRAELGEVGRIERIGRTLAWTSSGRSGRVVELTVEVRGDRTVLRLHESLGGLAGGLFGGVVGGAGGGGLGLVIPVALAIGAAPVLAPVLSVAWLGTVYGATRWGYGRVSRRRADQLEALMGRLVDAAKTGLEAEASPAAARVRVAADDEQPAEVAEQPLEAAPKRRNVARE